MINVRGLLSASEFILVGGACPSLTFFTSTAIQKPLAFAGPRLAQNNARANSSFRGRPAIDIEIFAISAIRAPKCFSA